MPDLTDKELDQLLRDAQERADSYPFDDHILEVTIPALVAEVRRLRAAAAGAAGLADVAESNAFLASAFGIRAKPTHPKPVVEAVARWLAHWLDDEPAWADYEVDVIYLLDLIDTTTIEEN